MTDRYAVIGNPIAHSKSPALHAAFARQCGQDIRYEAILGPLDGFRASVEAFRQAGGCGMNVTVPFKVEALALADTLTERARLAQAVNTLRFDADGIFGDNTDGIGLVNDIQQRLGFAIGGKRVLILGAGGAARGSVLPVAEAGPARLVIVNRTQARAEALREQFAGVAALDGRNATFIGHGLPHDCCFPLLGLSHASKNPLAGAETAGPAAARGPAFGDGAGVDMVKRCFASQN